MISQAGYTIVGEQRGCLGKGTDGLGSVGKCSIWWGRFGNAAGLRSLVFRLGKRVLKMFRCIGLVCSLVL